MTVVYLAAKIVSDVTVYYGKHSFRMICLPISKMATYFKKLFSILQILSIL